ncbi:D-alanyl-D-alanine carboxypeptidase/D-alanyl-D-alanine-endopeptidase [Streptomyces sp. C10-9-1]|uniref:D-alanyl-D-alanine carboxypeptidase/D-alanyl-D-alanine endopeptidase n=1 Tax=Streptomyces sp. C10-9-1 TaxID=1859285 RepID=UPI002113349B|nr:D-alanyl-D-alanine carboxypeptidase/D-alanyl-D-alanine-endopeptidase [Streptomyces sp. C10-9-1]MCQ6556329.1 D-alanyl-D-alanine carboxypeptidase/D-alanyl-D-alanine-endopeptidase [Streptomyces sp. C10-9-1]
MPKVGTWQLATGAAVVGLVLSVGAVTLAGPWDTGQRTAERRWAAVRADPGGAHHDASAAHRPPPAPSAPPVLDPLGGTRAAPADAPGAAADGLATALAPLLADPALGSAPTASVVDLATGRRLYGAGASRPMVPASTIKIATAAAALGALGPDHRVPTTVVAVPGEVRVVTLVGGGDATLDRDRLDDLAGRTARALGDRGAEAVRIAYDTALYPGARLHPIGPNDNIAPVSALMVDQGRNDPASTGPATRSADPAGEAARVFADRLSEHGVRVEGTPAPGRAPEEAVPVAQVLSAPLAQVVERMLTHSDNDIAESLARQTAVAAGRPADFAGAERAVTDQLRRLGLPLAGTRFADGSGLDRRDRATAELLTALLAAAADPEHPELRPVLTGLPVAGFTGTLGDRYPAASPGSGLVRAKTGTLTGVDTLAGTVAAPDGRVLAFAFLAGDTPSPYAARPALDRLAAALLE